MIKKTTHWLAIVLIILLVVLASIVISTRILLPKVNEYSVEISAYLSEKLNTPVSIDTINAQWFKPDPKFRISGITVGDRSQQFQTFSIGHISAEIDLIQSIKTFSPVFKQFEVDQLKMGMEQIEGRWTTILNRGQSTAIKPSTDSRLTINALLKVLSQQSKITFNRGSFVLKPENKQARTVSDVQFLIQNTRFEHQLSGEAKLNYYGEQSSVKFALQADELADDIIQTPFEAYARFSNLSEQIFALNLVDIGLDIKTLSLNSELWAELNNGVISDVTGRVSVNNLSFEEASLPTIDDALFDFTIHKTDSAYKLQLSNILLKNSGAEAFSIPGAVVSYNRFEPRYLSSIEFSQINLDQFSAWFATLSLSDQSARDIVNELGLKGRVENIALSWDKPRWLDYQLTAELDNVAVNAYSGAPAATGVSGLLRLNDKGGSVDLNSSDLSLFFPDFFQTAWQYQQAKGRVLWDIIKREGEISEFKVSSELLSIKHQKMSANGRFSFHYPVDPTKQTELSLLIGMRNNLNSDLLTYLPQDVISNSLQQWISQAVQGGQMKEGAFMLRTGTRNMDDDSSSSTQMFFDLKNTDINFSEQWPKVEGADAQVSVRDKTFNVVVSEGSIAKNKIHQLSVHNRAADSIVNVDGALSGDVRTTFKQLKKTPLNDVMPEQVSKWKLKGSHLSAIKIELPLNEWDKVAVNVSSKLKNAALEDPQYQLNFSDINGTLSYDTVKGLHSNQLALKAFNRKAKASIVTQQQGAEQKISIALTGTIKDVDLAKEVGFQPIGIVTGTAGYGARLDLCVKTAKCNQLVVNSDLAGFDIQLPAPWGKPAKQASKLQIVTHLNTEKAIWRYNYANIIRGITQGNRTQIKFGGAKPELPKTGGIYLAGTLSKLDFDQLAEKFKSSPKAGASGESLLKQVKSADFTFKNIRIMGELLAKSTVRVDRVSDAWHMNFQSQLATGNAIIPFNTKSWLSINLDKVTLNTQSATVKKAAKAKAVLLSTKAWPKINLRIDTLLLNKMNLGQWRAKLFPASNGYKATELKGAIADTQLTGELGWRASNNAATSFFNLQAKGKNFGAVLNQLGFSKVLESKSATLNTQLHWAGYPWGLTTAGLNGQLAFEMKTGRIIEAGTSANFLRIFGILNLNSVIKRLQLNFSDLLEKGVAYDSVTAKYRLAKGIATNEQPLRLLGTSANVEMTGSINLSKETLKQKMEVAIPLTSNAPIAALLLSTPQVAGVAFIVDKLIGKSLSKLTSLRYDIAGHWNNPQIKPVKNKNTSGYTEKDN